MAAGQISSEQPRTAADASRLALCAVLIAQVLTVFNVTALKVSIDAVAESLTIPASTVKTALVTYSVVVAGFTMLGAKIGNNFGSRRVYRSTVGLFGAAMGLTMLARGPATLLAAQALAGAAAAGLLPTLSAVVRSNFDDARQSAAIGWLNVVQATSIVPAYLLAGTVTTSFGWRATYAGLAAASLLAFVLGARLARGEARTKQNIDRVGVLLVVAAILFLGLGSDKLAAWGVLRAQPDAPFSWLPVSPALLVIIGGAVLVKLFVSWSRKCQAAGRTPLIAPEIVGTQRCWSALLSIFAVGAIGSGLTFLIPLYTEVIQGRTSLATAVVLIPFTAASFSAAILVLRLRAPRSASLIARGGFAVVAAGVALLGLTIRNDWRDGWVIGGMVLAGLGEGALATHLFHMLVTAVPSKVADDVTPLCGTTSYLASGVGVSLAGAVAIAVLGSSVHRDLSENHVIPAELKAEVNLDSVAFVSNDRLRDVMGATNATPEQIDEAIRINSAARLRALKVSFFTLAALALLALLPAGTISRARGGTAPEHVQNMQAT